MSDDTVFPADGLSSLSLAAFSIGDMVVHDAFELGSITLTIDTDNKFHVSGTLDAFRHLFDILFVDSIYLAHSYTYDSNTNSEFGSFAIHNGELQDRTKLNTETGIVTFTASLRTSLTSSAIGTSYLLELYFLDFELNQIGKKVTFELVYDGKDQEHVLSVSNSYPNPLFRVSFDIMNYDGSKFTGLVPIHARCTVLG